MEDYILSCCSTADLTKEHFDDRNIRYICFHYELDGKEYPDDLGQSIPFDKFYKAMEDGATTKTSQINSDEFEEYFEKMLIEGKDVVHVSLSSGISGVVNSAMIAKENLKEKYPDRNIYVVVHSEHHQDLWFIYGKLADFRDEGMSAAELYEWAAE